MLNPFKKKSESVYSPVPGRIISLDEVPDPVFAGRSVGDGFAIQPTDGAFCSPVDGELVLIAKTLHAFAVRTPEGAEILVHIGVDTVTLKGEGFTGHREPGETVSRGDVIISCDLADVGAKVPS
ncbi:MAG: PTS glucose transporter subunit IIA, partial [Actinomycetes bacterium]